MDELLTARHAMCGVDFGMNPTGSVRVLCSDERVAAGERTQIGAETPSFLAMVRRPTRFNPWHIRSTLSPCIGPP